MPDLDFAVIGAEAVPYAAIPLLNLNIELTNSKSGQTIESTILRCQIMIEPTRRNYRPSEQKKLEELFGEPRRWGKTLRSMLWTHTNTVIPRFCGQTRIELPVPCTFDLNIAATKFFDGVEEGDIPLCLLFSGTVFYRDENDNLQAEPISLEKEANYKLPVAVWRQMIDIYYPNSAWLIMRKDVFDLLSEYKNSNHLTSFEQVFERLLANEEGAKKIRTANG